MAKKRITFYLDSSVHDKFKKNCEKKGLVMSKRIQKLIEEEIKNDKPV